MKHLIILNFLLLSSCKWFNNSLINHPAIQREAFWNSPEEKLQNTIWDVGDTTISNEDRYELFQPYIKNLQGGYFGVGSIQNFTFSAWARSKWVWLMDFTKIVVAANKIHIAFLKRAKTSDEFRHLWSTKGRRKAYKIIQNDFRNEENYSFIRKAWRVTKPFLQKRFLLLDRLTKDRGYTTWLHNSSDYKHIRQLATKNRIRALHGDLNGDITVRGIADAAKDMQVKIRVIYFSNAEEYFKVKSKRGQSRNGYPMTFRENWLAIPIDKKSTVIRTISFLKNIYKWPEDSHYSTDRGFHYNIMPGKLFHQWLTRKDFISVISIVKTSKNFGDDGYSVVTRKANDLK